MIKEEQPIVIPENWEEVKKDGNHFYFQFDNLIKEIKFIEFPKTPFVSNGGPKGIIVDKLFFEEFSKKEKIAILWHEFYHCRISYIPHLILSDFLYCFYKKSYWEEEYKADKFSALKNNVEDCLRFLKVCKTLYDQNIVEYNPKTHPPIDERIKRIENA